MSNLTGRYVLALVVIGMISLTSLIALVAVTESQTSNVRVVDAAGRQRMMSQRIALLTHLSLGEAESDEARQKIRSDLRDSAHLMLKRHDELAALLVESRRLGRSADMDLFALYSDATAGIDPLVRAYVASALRVANAENQIQAQAAAQKLFAIDPSALLERLEQIVQGHVQSSIDGMQFLRRLQIGAFLFLVASLIGVGMFVIRPMTKRVERQIEALAASETALSYAQGRLINAVESIEDAFALFNADDCLVMCNSSYRRYFPFVEERIRPGAAFSDIVHMAAEHVQLSSHETPDDWVKRRIAYHRKPTGHFEYSLKDSRRLRVSERRTAEGGIVSVSRDLTVDARREAELRAMRRQADAANQAKSEFLSRMSHELRTPMNAILGFAQLLNMNPKEPLSSSQADYVGYILTSGEHLLKLINDVLDLSRVEAGDMTMSRESLLAWPMVEEVAAGFRVTAERAQVEMRLHHDGAAPKWVCADPVRLRQILNNLVSNAIKYNHPGGHVTISLTNSGSGQARILVADNGQGISSERQREVFEPFNRLGAEQSTVEGTGIGLTITRKLVEMMEGSIHFTSLEGKGTTFWVDLPLGEEAASLVVPSRKAATISPRVAKGGFTLLYVEDNPPNILLMEKFLSTLPNVRFVVAPTAESGIEKAAQIIPDIIILDINLPGMDGFAALRILRSMPETRHIPVLALTAAAITKDIERGRKAGFRDYLFKPIDMPIFLAALEDALTRKSETKES